MSKTELDPEF